MDMTGFPVFFKEPGERIYFSSHPTHFLGRFGDVFLVVSQKLFNFLFRSPNTSEDSFMIYPFKISNFP